MLKKCLEKDGYKEVRRRARKSSKEEVNRERNGKNGRGGKEEKEGRRERGNEILLIILVFPFYEASFCITKLLDLQNY